MTDINTLAALSDALQDRATSASPAVACVDWGASRHVSAIVWRDGLIVTSEQSLPRAEAYRATLPGGQRAPATLAGRDPSTNVALLRVEGAADPHLDHAQTPPGVGGLVMAVGSDGEGRATARLGVAEVAGPTWQSQAGGRIDYLLRIGVRLTPPAEGGPVIDSRGRLLGMSTFGPRRTVLVIPATTISRAADALAEHGRVPRGWLGVGLHPVMLPRDLAERAGAESGLMVVNLADGSPAAASLLPGDILLTVDGVAVVNPRDVAGVLNSGAVGRAVPLRVLRGGELVDVHVTIAARPE